MVIRPIIGTAPGLLLAGDVSDLQSGVPAATGGVTALASHPVKLAIRLGVNTSPEPASNIAVSTAEDVTVASEVSLALVAPWWRRYRRGAAGGRRRDRGAARRPEPPGARARSAGSAVPARLT